MKQLNFSFIQNYKQSFGGSLLAGRRKTSRPLSFRKPLHLVLKSTGSSCFNPGNRKLQQILLDQASKYKIRVYDLSLNWSHIHILVRLPSREAYLAFIRTVTALITACVSKQKGKALSKLFDLRPFTRILSWGKDFRNVKDYHKLNDQEAWGLITRRKLRSG